MGYERGHNKVPCEMHVLCSQPQMPDEIDGRVGAVHSVWFGCFYSEDMNLEKERLRLDGQIVEQA